MKFLLLTILSALMLFGTSCASYRVEQVQTSAISKPVNTALVLHVTTNKDVPLYETGEKVVFKIMTRDGNGLPKSGVRVNWKRYGDDGIKESGAGITGEAPLEITTSMTKPGMIYFDAVTENGKKFFGGAVVSPDQIKGTPAPKGFDEFWDAQLKKLAMVPVKVLERKLLKQYCTPKRNVYDVKVACAGGMPVSGILTMPAKAPNRSCSARVTFIGYCVCGAQVQGNGSEIVFNVNAHGIENLQPKSYYQNLSKQKLNRYGLSAIQKPEDSYFLGMALRVKRAIEYVKTLPEWNGTDLTAAGHSQGGMQAVIGAALDPDVTLSEPDEPWQCDLSGFHYGRDRGFAPSYNPAIEFFDPVHLAKRIKCEVRIRAGLGDHTCSPSGMIVLYNNLKCRKSLEMEQGRTHGTRAPWSSVFVIKP